MNRIHFPDENCDYIIKVASEPAPHASIEYFPQEGKITHDGLIRLMDQGRIAIIDRAEDGDGYVGRAIIVGIIP